MDNLGSGPSRKMSEERTGLTFREQREENPDAFRAYQAKGGHRRREALGEEKEPDWMWLDYTDFVKWLEENDL